MLRHHEAPFARDDGLRTIPPMPPNHTRTGETMNVEELKTLLERARQFSKENNGKVMMAPTAAPSASTSSKR
jgi:hypothetical protein